MRDTFEGETRTTDRADVSSGRRLRAMASAVERNRRLDEVAASLAGAGARLDAAPSLGAALRGGWLGHALHPLLTDFPLGFWMSTSALDLFGGREARPSAERLLGLGLLASVPTVVTGLAEAERADTRSRRVAVVHAGLNSTALALYASSYVARKRRRHRLAAALGVGGGVAATIGGYFGGHLSFVLANGVERRLSPDAAGGPVGP